MKNKAVKAQGITCPIVREGDNIVDIVVNSILEEVEEEYEDKIYSGREQAILGIQHEQEYTDEYGETYVPYTRTRYKIYDKDIIGITESLVARSNGEYITVDEIADDIKKKFGKDATICLINPIYSRNRFATILKGIARAAKRIIMVMPYYDEVGNPRGVNPFTGVNIEKHYQEVCEKENCEFVAGEKDYHYQIITDGADYVDGCIFCGLHDFDRFNDGFLVEEYCDRYKFYTLKDICSDKSPDWGLLGTNVANGEKLKLFPSKKHAQKVCDDIKKKIKKITDTDVIVCVYGDGCFKDPVGGIWEFADPTTMPAYTDKELMESTPNEVKLKNLIDSVDENTLQKSLMFNEAVNLNKQGGKGALGTTPRVYRDLLASLMDLTSGSGDRATPVVLVQNYF